MLKYFEVIACLWFIYVNFIPSNVCFKCIHDEVSSADVPSSQVTYREMRNKRDKHHEMFQPLRIHPYFDDIDSRMPDNVIYKIKHALNQVIRLISETVKVRQSFSPFLLERQNCAQKWRTGNNKEKCSHVKKGPELCSVKSTDFAIPDEFLYELELYDFTKLRPIKVIKSGHGVKDANFILFVISRRSSWCNEEGVQAYGSYCRLDNQSRPIAGLLNMCPTYFRKKMFEDSHYYNVLMHELIHILGFSHNLFPKFKTCSSVYDCESPKQIVLEDSHNIQRLVFPELVKSMQLHSGCQDEDFGAPLDKSSGKNKYASHWHPVLMYTSVMTPTIIEDDYVVIDNVTLALLASTGWYQVQFDKSQELKIGKGEGCDFGFKDKCGDSSYLCDPKSDSLSCDILHHTIGKCESLVSYHPCGVYIPNDKNSCSDDSEIMVYDLSLSTLHHEPRCILVSTDKNPKGTPECLTISCVSAAQLEIHFNSTSVYCVANEKVKSTNVTVNCPKDISFCEKPLPNMEHEYCSINSTTAVSVRMHFSDPKFRDLLKYNSFKNFQVSTLRAIAAHMATPTSYFYNATLYVFKEMHLDFTICPPLNLSNAELGTLIRKAQQFLKSPTFAHIFKGATELPVAATEFSTDPDYAISFSDHEGLRLMSVIPIVCAIFVVVTAVASVIRYTLKQRPKAKGEAVELEELSQSNSNAPSSATLLA